MPDETQGAELIELFERFGPVHYIDFFEDKKACNVHYDNKDDALKAISTLSRYVLSNEFEEVQMKLELLKQPISDGKKDKVPDIQHSPSDVVSSGI